MKLATVFKLMIFSLVLVSCSGSGDNDEQTEEQNYHVISGNISDADGKKAKLMVFEGGKETFIDSCIVAEGKFELKTRTKELREYLIFLGDEVPIILFLDENSNGVEISGPLSGIGENYEVKGSEASVSVHDYMVYLKQFYQTEMDLIQQINSINPADTKLIDPLMAKLDSISAIQREYAIEHIMKDTTSPFSWMLLRELIPSTGMQNFDPADIIYFEKVSAGMKSKYPYSEYPTYIDQDIENIKAQFAAPPSLDEISPAPEIALSDFNGKIIALSSLKGKVVLVDFWASWCMPCRQENPNVVKMYEKYKDKGFTVYSVSLDENKEAWKKAVEADNLSWPNHVSDLKGWSSDAAAAYGVNAIPATFLLDRDGNIIAKNLRGNQLEQKLQELLD